MQQLHRRQTAARPTAPARTGDMVTARISFVALEYFATASVLISSKTVGSDRPFALTANISILYPESSGRSSKWNTTGGC